MARLLITDDETTTREGLKKFINWYDIGIEEVIAADDGVSALEICRRFEPDILLTDVRMPVMDGIQLAEHIKKLYPNCRIIFLSGHSDKEYLKSAISLKAFSYLEKPVNLDEVKSSVFSALQELLREKQEEIHTMNMRNMFSRNAPLLMQELVLNLITPGLASGSIKEESESLGLNYESNNHFTVIVSGLTLKPDCIRNSSENTKNIILKCIYEKSGSLTCSFWGGFDTYGNLTAIILGKLDSYNSALEFARQLKCIISGSSDCILDVSMGIGKPVKRTNQVCSSYDSALIALRKCFFLGQDKFCLFTPGSGQQYVLEDTVVSNFTSLLKTGNVNDALTLIQDISNRFSHYPDTDIDYVRNVYFSLLNMLDTIAKEHNITMDSKYSKGGYNWKTISEFTYLAELSQYLMDEVKEYFEIVENLSFKGSKIYEIKKFIDGRFSESNLSIKDIAERVSLTQAHLCYMFKKCTGVTINDYITETRIVHAKELLKNKSLKLLEVSKSVGYEDPNYFSKLFKKSNGFTPSQYRNKYLV